MYSVCTLCDNTVPRSYIVQYSTLHSTYFPRIINSMEDLLYFSRHGGHVTLCWFFFWGGGGGGRKKEKKEKENPLPIYVLFHDMTQSGSDYYFYFHGEKNKKIKK